MKKVFFRYCIIQCSYWSFFAAMPAYLTARMLSMGMEPSLLGILISANMACAFIGALFWGRIVDRLRAGKKYVVFGFMSAAFLAVLIFLFAGNKLLLFFLYPLLGFVMSPIPTNIDSWVIAIVGRVESGSKSRSFGTLGFAVTMLICGQLIRHVGYTPLPFIALGFAALGIVTSLFQPELPPLVFEKQDSRKKGSVKALLSVPDFLLLTASVFFTGMAISPLNSMKVLIFESVGADVGTLGTDSFIGCLAQWPFLSMSGHLKRIKVEYRLIAAVLCMLCFILLLMFAGHPAIVIAGTVMQNAGFGLMLPTMREMTERTVSPGLRTTANSITDVAYGSVSGMIAALWSGAVMEFAGKSALGALSAGIQGLAIFCAFILIFRNRPGHKEIPSA